MQGGCFCGSVRYEVQPEPREAYYCHCRDCQVLSGAPFHVLAIAERSAVKVLSGELAAYRHKADSGSEMTREFCPKCGTPLFVKSTRFPEIAMFTPSTLDEPESVQPTFQIWTTSKISWSNIRDELASFPRGVLDGGSQRSTSTTSGI